MKKIAFLLLALAMLLTACSTGEMVDLTTLPIRGGGELLWAISIGSIDDLEEHSDVIVRGIIGNPEKELFSKINPNSWGATLYSLEVTAVYKGENSKTGESIQVGDALPYIEPYRTLRDENGELYLLSIEGFIPSAPGEEYLFFLYYDDIEANATYYGTYSPTRGRMGRYPVPEDAIYEEGGLLINKYAGSGPNNAYWGVYQHIVFGDEFYIDLDQKQAIPDLYKPHLKNDYFVIEESTE